MNRQDAVRLAYRHAAVALGRYRDHHLDDELDAEPVLSEADRVALDEQLDELQAYLEAVGGMAKVGPAAFDHLPAHTPAPIAAAPPDWVAAAVAMEAKRADEARGPNLTGSPDTGYCAPAIGVHVEPHRGCVMR